MATYLVDFENVHDLGLRGIQALTNGDMIYIIYTDNANRISLDCFNNISVPFSVIKVEGGSQSLDMHLVSFLGYLIGRESDPNESYVIVSQDSDYSTVATYWCNYFDYSDKVKVQPTICGEPILFYECYVIYATCQCDLCG